MRSVRRRKTGARLRSGRRDFANFSKRTWRLTLPRFKRVEAALRKGSGGIWLDLILEQYAKLLKPLQNKE